MDAITLSNAIQKEKPRRITCDKLMEITLDHINEINPKYNAIILLRDRNELLEQAKECDQELLLQQQQQHQDDTTTTLGWLHGIPTAIKDLSNVKGLPTTNGGSPLSSLTAPATTNDLYVEHMINAGAIIIGKTNIPEYGLGSNTYNDIWGYTLNPFDISLSAGGSSGGAAVAISTLMLVIADGTDNMGSLRNPAGWNNIYSLRPTSGLIPRTPPTTTTTTKNTTAASSIPTTMSASSILPHPDSTPGPMARTPLDCALLLQTMVGNTERFNAKSLLVDDNNTVTMTTTTRIGWLGDWQGHLPFEDGILTRCRAALENWSFVSNNNKSSHNVMVSNVEDNRNNIRSSSQQPLLFSFDKLWDSYNTVRFATRYENFSTKDFDIESLLSKKEGGLKEELIWEIKMGQSITNNEMKMAKDVYGEYAEWLSEMFNEYDVLALPSAQVYPFPIEERYPKTIGDRTMDTYHRWMEVSVPVSFGGLPCMTIPVPPSEFGGGSSSSSSSGNDKDNNDKMCLPIGIQLFANRGDDLKLLKLANEYYHIP